MMSIMGMGMSMRLGSMGMGIEMMWLSSPLPASPTRGEVWAGVLRTIEPSEPAGTSPLVGEAGRGVRHV